MVYNEEEHMTQANLDKTQTWLQWESSWKLRTGSSGLCCHFKIGRIGYLLIYTEDLIAHNAVEADLKLSGLLSPPPKCLSYRHAPPCQA